MTKKQSIIFWQDKEYKNLTPLEKDFLVAYILYATKKSFVFPNKKVGVSLTVGKSLLKSLIVKKTIYRDNKLKRYVIPEPYEDELIRQIDLKKTKSIFNVKTIELYEVLKKKYNSVFPEISLCTFIEQSAVSHLIKGKKKFGYFLSSRVDFLICDEKGFPIKVYEFQGTYHRNPSQVQIDAFKKKLIESAGIEVIYLNSNELPTFTA